MVTKKTLEGYLFTLEEYFDYIIESKNNGQHSQSKMLFDEMSDKQKEHFFEYIEALYHYDSEVNSEMITLVKYFTI